MWNILSTNRKVANSEEMCGFYCNEGSRNILEKYNGFSHLSNALEMWGFSIDFAELWNIHSTSRKAANSEDVCGFYSNEGSGNILEKYDGFSHLSSALEMEGFSIDYAELWTIHSIIRKVANTKEMYGFYCNEGSYRSWSCLMA